MKAGGLELEDGKQRNSHATFVFFPLDPSSKESSFSPEIRQSFFMFALPNLISVGIALQAQELTVNGILQLIWLFAVGPTSRA